MVDSAEEIALSECRNLVRATFREGDFSGLGSRAHDTSLLHLVETTRLHDRTTVTVQA
jgi:hypothetical protein